MALKFKFKTKDEIPAEHLPHYAEREGAWVLDVDGAVEKSKLDEFRNTNVSLIKERDDLKKRYEGIDPEQARAALTEKQRAEEEKLLSGGPTPHPAATDGILCLGASHAGQVEVSQHAVHLVALRDALDGESLRARCCLQRATERVAGRREASRSPASSRGSPPSGLATGAMGSVRGVVGGHAAGTVVRTMTRVR